MEKKFNMDNLIIVGAGGHGKVVADLALSLNKYKEIYFLDDCVKSDYLGIKVAGKVCDVDRYVHNCEYIVAIGDNLVRKNITEFLCSKGVKIATLIHKNAVVSKSANIGVGTVVMAGAIINASAKIGNSVIINTGAIVEHDCYVGDFSHVSVGACLLGTVKSGVNVFLGAKSTIKNNLTVCDNVVLGAGTVVVKDICEDGVYIGIPAYKKR